MAIDQIDQCIADFASFVWGLPLLILLTGGGLYLLIRSRFIPFRYIDHAAAILRGQYDDPDDLGQISHFAALTTALSTTIGMGNIAGVAVAINIGGPGAIFWMWVSAIVGMATKFFTATLSILYRGKDSRGQLQGGPMYFIVEGLGNAWKPLAIFFSLAGLIGALPVFNVNQLTQAIADIVLVPQGIPMGFATKLGIGISLAALTTFVILGGLQKISKTASRLVPAMVVLYFILVVLILGIHHDQIPYYLQLIFTDAFAASQYQGDPFFGGVLGALIVLGIRRGAFSNEAGIGTAPMAHGAAKTNEAVREGLVAMLGPAIDTLLVCTLTAMAILVTGVWQNSGVDGVTLTAHAFETSLPGIGNYLLLLCILIFGISSLFSYSYYGSKCLSFIWGADKKHYYNYLYIGSIVLAAVTSLDIVINLIDGFFALMAIPTMLATLILAPRVVQEAKHYFARLHGPKNENHP